MKRVFLRLLCALPLAWCISACSQAEGEPCQVETDCASGLMCCTGDSTRGVCRETCPATSTGGRGGSGGRGGNGGSSGEGESDASTVDASSDDSGTE